ncbi:D-Ala-D-Ala carboxypeptidase family metallohydrolase [Psychrobacter sp. AOP7-B1-24]|uniref:D-Ala-D-Ala carboxypeptidase family metallohydrolase n=1 Tax=Psychrobacter sp. AOP7-B1-24 TaxID=3457645 RepID=UPI00402B553F
MNNKKLPRNRQIHKPVIALLVLYASSIPAHADIISDNSERRIQVRQGGSTIYVQPSENVSDDSSRVTSEKNVINRDSMQGLIAQKQRDFNLQARLSIEENKSVNIARSVPDSNTAHNHGDHDVISMDFNVWLNNNSYRAKQVAEYQRYLISQVGAKNVPPLSQLLTTARSWKKCGYEPYQLPPKELWPNIVPTLRLYSELKKQGILPASSEIRSVYRSPGLNDCAGGADSSKHMNASAMDIWVPEYESNLWQLSTMQDGLCQFWQYQGAAHNFGLGLYATGAIHLDTDGYRKWGFHHASSSSSCRY